jgi:hypothetical protein
VESTKKRTGSPWMKNDSWSLVEQAGYSPNFERQSISFLPRLEIISSQIKGSVSMGLLMSLF